MKQERINRRDAKHQLALSRTEEHEGDADMEETREQIRKAKAGK